MRDKPFSYPFYNILSISDHVNNVIHLQKNINRINQVNSKIAFQKTEVLGKPQVTIDMPEMEFNWPETASAQARRFAI